MFAELLRSRLAGILTLTDEQVSVLEAHYRLLLHWNKVLNLTAVRTEEQIVERHYCESLFLGLHLPRGEWSIADVGSGGGFPGFPVAVLRPECAISLVESHQRKAVFLREASRGINNVRVIAARVESVRQNFDWLISRAVRFSDIRAAMERSGGRVALLVGEVDEDQFAAFQWENAIRLPWGKRRYLLVSRGTGRE